MKFLRHNLPLILLILIALCLHGVNLEWGSPYFFHPDERNIAMAVTGLHFPTQLNPHFFAYGSLPIYLIYILSVISSGFSAAVSFSQAILVGRFISAILATALIPLIYLIGQKLWNKTTGLLAATLSVFCVGIIQFAHFATFEMWLTFFSLLLLWFCLRLREEPDSLRPILGIGLVFGILCATKISSLVLLPLCLLSLFWHLPKRGEWKKFLLRQIIRSLLLMALALLVFLITNPFVVLDFPSFQNSISYESAVALGTLPVFYTQTFLRSTPAIYQLMHVFPFLLNPIITIVSISSCIVLLFLTLKKRSSQHFLFLLFLLLLFLSQAVLFVKWTRYMVPTLPFLLLLTASQTLAIKNQALRRSLVILLVLSGLLFTTAFLKTVYLSPDPRIAAAKWASTHLPPGTHVLSEVYDLGIIPLGTRFPNTTLFNFYDLDQNPTGQSALSEKLTRTQVIVLPSQRLIKPRLNHPHLFPISSHFYQKLTTGALGFRKVYETPCPVLCRILYLGNPINAYEETTSVFDHPTVMIFKRP